PNKPKRRNLRVDAIAWLLFLCGIVLVLSVLSYEPTDADEPAQNLLGVPGHLLARELFLTLGSAVHVLLTGWFVVVLMLLVRRSWLAWSRRTVGWLVLIPLSAIAADYLGPDHLGASSSFGSGGALGLVGREIWQDELPGSTGALVYA